MSRFLLFPFWVFLLMPFFEVSSQDLPELHVNRIDSALLKNANAVVRVEEILIEISAVDAVTVKTKRTVTVLNRYGERSANFSEWYDPSRKINKLSAVIYDSFGNEIYKYKKKDFKDRSYIDGFSLMRDDRIKYFEYTPVRYPYTVIFESEIKRSSTAFIKSWVPVPRYGLSVEKSYYKIVNPTKIPLKSKEINLEEYSIFKNNSDYELSYEVANIVSKRSEIMSPAYFEVMPIVKVFLNNFTLEGMEGSAKDWKALGKWYYEKLLMGRNELPESTIEEINNLVAEANTKAEKAKLIYEYVQNKTRYISVQLGIGGWMPFLASDVDRLGYGDCKALTNYTKALLDSQGILSFYTVVFADERRDIDADFASIEGDHVILNIPDKEEDIWLECTNQTIPFNFIGDFTDDRNVLVVKREGGEIKRTKKYFSEENILNTNAVIQLKADNSMEATINREARGLEYNWNYQIQFETPKNLDLHYKEKWSYINNLHIKSVNLHDDKETVQFVEDLLITCSSYSKKAGSRLLVTPNVFNRNQGNLPVYENRRTPLVIRHGYQNTDEYEINLPAGYLLSKLPESKFITNEFGTYSYELEMLSPSKIKFKRTLKMIDGIFPKEKYESYRQFWTDIKNTDKTRIVLKKE
ncbi:DUF3857 domain-containing protein [Aquimarina intermedia]|uniref:Uncharacterized protein DUF3858 n=1 Tax=Aquimarina intermedia TaxID=350814 RepID=A0A5S5CB70_9FLAO|nr:DUF3857 domain-containing protein [Aquimarina intermedia]TYP75878.1 uncharacterized protein DUF3858 [Aquimarina intermedia]